MILKAKSVWPNGKKHMHKRLALGQKQGGMLRYCRLWSGMNGQRLPGAIILASAVLLSSCLMVPIPTQTELTPSVSNKALDALHPRISRAEALMNLGNPQLVAHGYDYLGYEWKVSSFDTFVAVAGGGYEIIPGEPHVLHMLVLEFDPDGKMTRIKEFSNTKRDALRAEVKEWIRAGANPTP